MKMTKRPMLFILATIVALSGCVASGPSRETTQKKASDQLAFPPPPDDPRFYFERMLRSSADIVPDDESNVFKRALTGEGTKGEGFAKPYAIAAHHGRIFVGDSARRAVLLFDIPAQKFSKIGVEEDDDGNGKLFQPMGLDVDQQGNLYVLDAKLKQILIYNTDGKYMRSLGESSMLYKPAGLAVTPDGTRVYAVDIGGSSSNEHKIVVLDGVTGKRLPDIGKRGSGPGEFNLPRDITIAPDGSLYVVDGGNFRVQKFDKDGKYISTFGSIGRQSGQFSRPKEAGVDPSGNVYVIDTAFGNFQIFNPEGKLLLAIGSRSNSNGPGLYSLPAGIAVDDDGRIYVVDQFFRKVDVFRPVGLAEDGGWIGKFNTKKLPAEPSKDSPIMPSKVPNADPIKESSPPNQELNAAPGK
jgi:DNA-binding beta-propeller fold protein YncE